MKKFVFLCISMLCAISVICVCVLVNATNKGYGKFDFTMEIDETSVERFSFDDLSLEPGGSVSYSVGFKSAKAGKYSVSLAFEKVADKGIGEYVEVEIVCDEYRTSENLKELLTGNEKIEFDCEINRKSAAGMTVRFVMPCEVGNEAMGTSADFDIKITVSNENP